jgi:zinc-ribbon domain
MSVTPPSASAPRFCRKCGAPLRPGTRFCHHCGNPVGAEAPAPAMAPVAPALPLQAPVSEGAPLPPPGHIPPPPPGAFVPPPPGPPQWAPGGLVTGQVAQGRAHKGRFSRLPVLGKVGVVFLGLVGLGIVAEAFIPSPTKCTYSCKVVTGTLLPSGKTYSNQLISFDYPPSLTQEKAVPGAQVSLANNLGEADIFDGQGQENLTALIQQYAQKAGNSLQDITALGPIYGAQIGFVPGAGEFYSAQLQSQNGADVPFGLGIIAAQSGKTWAVVMVGAVCYQGNKQDTCSESLFDSQQQTFGASQSYDDILAHWHWGG